MESDEIFLRREWSNNIDSKKRIFLDINFWLRIRDESSQEATKFLAKAKALVAADLAVFPVTQMLIHEVLKQSDSQSKQQTFLLFDRLSLGAVLVPENECVIYETGKLLEAIFPNFKYNARSAMLWTKPAHYFGHGRFMINNPDGEANQSASNSLLNFTWNLTFLQISQLLPSADQIDLSFKSAANMINEEKNKQKLPHFEQLLRDEIYGSVDAFLPAIEAAYADFLGSMNQVSPVKLSKEFRNVIANCIILKPELRKIMPTIFVNASFHSLFRQNKAQQFKGNDLYDGSHLCSALPYFDVYFGEKFLCDLGKRAPLKLFDLFNIKYSSSFEEATKILDDLTKNAD